MTVVMIDGKLASANRLSERLAAEEGHFTTLQVRHGEVRGLDAHIARLQSASRALHREDLDPTRVLRYLRTALIPAPPEATARIEVYRAPDEQLRILVRLDEPRHVSAAPLALHSVRYGRPDASIRHVDAGAEKALGREARAHGAHDALLCTPDGHVTETTRANLGVASRGRIIWPEGASLVGTTQQLLTDVLRADGVRFATLPVRLADLTSFDTTFTTSATGVEVVGSVDGTPLPFSSLIHASLVNAFRRAPITTLRA